MTLRQYIFSVPVLTQGDSKLQTRCLLFVTRWRPQYHLALIDSDVLWNSIYLSLYKDPLATSIQVFSPSRRAFIRWAAASVRALATQFRLLVGIVFINSSLFSHTLFLWLCPLRILTNRLMWRLSTFSRSLAFLLDDLLLKRQLCNVDSTIQMLFMDSSINISFAKYYIHFGF